ncbi:MAG TPA: prepilin peptidase, partial [Gaiellaceae bacterium]|nr:prepilin peptidase [Gaiellaceae bacterium]
MSFALAAAAFAPGLAIGSFLNVVAARVPRKRSIVSPGSACMSCGHELAWYENVPVVSYLVLRGRCRGCGARIGIVYPAVELLTALLVAASFLTFGWSGESFLAAFFCVTLVTISATDLSHRIVPNVIVLPAAAVVLVAMTVLEPSAEWALGAFGAALFLFLAALAHPKGMGMGDVKFALLLGAMLGRVVPVA